MICPHCTVKIHFEQITVRLGRDPDGFWYCGYGYCPSCQKMIILVKHWASKIGDKREDEAFAELRAKTESGAEEQSFIVRPLSALRPIPPQVPEHIAKDYLEASAVLSLSPTASAALSRRCLERVLTTQGADQYRLDGKIAHALEHHGLPSHLRNSIDGLRAIGNFASHPGKAGDSQAIVDVEPGEAEWSLVVLEGLFDFYYVQPAILEAKLEALNEKLRLAGEKPLR